jgi:hypothetical protein
MEVAAAGRMSCIARRTDEDVGHRGRCNPKPLIPRTLSASNNARKLHVELSKSTSHLGWVLLHALTF